MTCTGISANWCPRCGDCICPVDKHGEHITADGLGFGRDHPDCPLHAPGSPHGEIEVATTLWGAVELEAP